MNNIVKEKLYINTSIIGFHKNYNKKCVYNLRISDYRVRCHGSYVACKLHEANFRGVTNNLAIKCRLMLSYKSRNSFKLFYVTK